VPSSSAARRKLRWVATATKAVRSLREGRTIDGDFASTPCRFQRLITEWEGCYLLFVRRQKGPPMNKAWLITGISSGLGKLLAQKALARGDPGDRNQSERRSARRLARALPGKASHFRAQSTGS
jgi:hypothetical protein